MTFAPPANSRRVAFATVVALVALAAAMAAGPAAAKAKGCAEKVVADWYDHADHKVHGHYPLNCYREALASLDSSVQDYTNAREAITQALAAAILLKGGGGYNGPTPGTPATSIPRGAKWIEYHNTYDFGLDTAAPGSGPAAPTSNANPSSVPVPLLVLAGLALVLLLAGGGSYIARRIKANRSTPPATDS
jgi:hypothetical protein